MFKQSKRDEKFDSYSSNNPIKVAQKAAILIFDVLDFLNSYLNQVKKNDNVAKIIENFLGLFPNDVLAEVCYQCGEYHRSFIYFEGFFSKLSKNEKKNHWTFLVQIYAKLGDGDSIKGVAEKMISAGLEWSPRQKLFIENITGDWQDPFTNIEKILNDDQTIEIEEINAALNCYIQYNKSKQGLFVADEMLKKLYDKNVDKLAGHEVKAEALLRLSKFDEITEIFLDRTLYTDVGHWGTLSAKLHLKLRSGDHLSFLDEMKSVRLAIMNNFKLYESHQSVYQLNYQEILHLHMLTDFDKASEVIQQIKSAKDNDRVAKAKKCTKRLISELNARKELFQLTAIQTEAIVSLHRMLLRVSFELFSFSYNILFFIFFLGASKKRQYLY